MQTIYVFISCLCVGEERERERERERDVGKVVSRSKGSPANPYPSYRLGK